MTNPEGNARSVYSLLPRRLIVFLDVRLTGILATGEKKTEPERPCVWRGQTKRPRELYIHSAGGRDCLRAPRSASCACVAACARALALAPAADRPFSVAGSPSVAGSLPVPLAGQRFGRPRQLAVRLPTHSASAHHLLSFSFTRRG